MSDAGETEGPQPWRPGDAPLLDDAKRHAPATLRNRDAILSVLREELPDTGLVIEVASGSGEHASFFAAAMPQLDWQPSDPDLLRSRQSTHGARKRAGKSLRPALNLDAASADWPLPRADAILCCNMVHIAPWAAAEGLFGGAGRLLPPDAPLILYGPFIEADVPTADSNLAFDTSLRDRDPAWGLRDVAALDALAEAAGLRRTRRIAMPTNNLTLVWRRR